MAVDTSREVRVMELLKQRRQREAMDYLYDNFNGTELMELSQLTQRISSMADGLQGRKAKDNEQRRRTVGGRGGEGQGFIPA